MINKCYLCRKDGKIMKKKTVKILMGVALISTLLGACSTNRSTQNEQKTLNTEISKIVKNHSEMQIAIQNGHLCHVRRSVCDIIGGQPKTN